MRLATLGLVALAALAVAGIAAATLAGGGDGHRRRAAFGGGSTVAVTRQTLVDRELVDGTLGFAGTRTVVNRLGGSGGSGGDGTGGDGSGPGGNSPAADKPSSSDDSYRGSGTVTGLARPGSVVRRGAVLYSLDGNPVVLMYGSRPAYRSFHTGMGGGLDVLELERNLAALGFDPGTVDRTFTADTAVAVETWQRSVGLEATGRVALGRIVFLPGPRRIGQLKASVGSVLSAGSEVLDTSSTKRVVSIELDASLQSLAHTGEAVEVTMPSDAVVRGRITKVGRVAREQSSGDDAQSPTGDGDKTLVVDVTVELRSNRGVGRLDEAPVSVGLAKESRRHVLAVPVNALVARRGGGYGVELAGTRRIVPVETGLFAGGYVEIAGAAVREGTRVVVPSA